MESKETKTMQPRMAYGGLAFAAAFTISAAPVLAQQQTVNYQCGDGRSFQAQFFEGTVQLVFNQNPLNQMQTLSLPQAVSASGTRYSDGITTFWDQGGEAFIEMHEQIVYDQCIAQPIPTS